MRFKKVLLQVCQCSQAASVIYYAITVESRLRLHFRSSARARWPFRAAASAAVPQ